MAKLTEEQREEIINRTKNGESHETISKEFNITKSYVYLLTKNMEVDKIEKESNEKQKTSNGKEVNNNSDAIKELKSVKAELQIMFQLYGQQALAHEKYRVKI